VAARYVAAGAGHEVGGDFYDLFELDGGGWAAVLGDVCGKGPEAAALTALARHTIRAESDRLAPSAVLAALNRAVIRHQTGMRFLTACYVWLRPEASGAEVTVGRGGHTPALILRRGGEVERVQPPGPLVGIYSDAVFGDVDVRLAPGDAVVLYSDGITEARGADGSLYGPERLVGALTSGPRDSAEEVAESVARSVSAFEPVPSDDVALLVLRLAD
jgi:sigma-B regulation protein RsbU (phosphoserine phosphatase)